MTSHFKSWREQQDEVAEAIQAALDERRRKRMAHEATRAAQKWGKNLDALNTMQFMTWHIQKKLQ